MSYALFALFVAGVIFWWIWISPFSFTYSDTTLDIDEEATHRVFAFGTLRNHFVRSLIIRRYVPTEPARLDGYRRYGLDLLPDEDSYTEGVIFYVTPTQLRRLDRYERVGVKYERYLYTLEDGEYAWVYRLISDIQPILEE